VSAHLSQAQVEQEAMGLCFPEGSKTAIARGTIGGEAHDSYVFHAAAGRKVTVSIRSAGNRAQFTVSKTEFGEQVTFGKEQFGTWTGTIPETGVFFISVVAHPSAYYVLRVKKQ
jgi:hypothetical protein